MMGNAEQAMKLLGRTDEFARADLANAESWVKFFDETDVYAMIGTVHTELAQNVDVSHTRYAIPALRRATEAYGGDMARSKTFSLGMLATNHMLEGDIDYGAKVGGKALDCAEGLKSARVKKRMEPLRQEALRRSNNSDARELAERMNEFFS